MASSTTLLTVRLMLCMGVLHIALALLLMTADTVHGAPAPFAVSLQDKVVAGYQGWFRSEEGHWWHWSTTGEAPSPPTTKGKSGLAFDLWPEMSEYKTTYATDLQYADGRNASLFSGQDASTVDLHVSWAKTYGIDALFLQRFVSELPSEARDRVLDNLQTSAETREVAFSVMYDLSGAALDELWDTLTSDWNTISPNVTTSTAYQHHNGKPVVTLWGFGFAGRPNNITLALQLVEWFHDQGVLVMGGVPFYWRSGKHDAELGWDDVYNALDIISPWAVGRYSDDGSFDTLVAMVVNKDMAKVQTMGESFAPVIFPGFSWSNLKDDPSVYNAIPRNKGGFMAHQAAAYTSIESDVGGPLFIYIAMFDEVNEGTAIFKAANDTRLFDTSDVRFLTLERDVDEDHYLALAGTVGRLLRGDRCGRRAQRFDQWCNATSVLEMTQETKASLRAPVRS